jgi:hypothetical protein
VRVAVVGGGVYGCTTAVELARAGHQVELFERHAGLLYGASRANQGRLHHGYHYPRSLSTARAARSDAARFALRFPTTIDTSARHYYCIASTGSLTSADEFLAHCDLLGDGHVVTASPLVWGVDVTVRVPEAFIDVRRLREVLIREVRAAGVRVHLGVTVDPDSLGHDLVVMATYGRPWPVPLRYEVCEVMLIELGAHYRGHSFVILDGPFACLDPVPGTGLHAVYHVEHSVHHASVGRVEVPEHLVSLLDRGPVRTVHARTQPLLLGARRFLDRVGLPVPYGSMFTVRAVLPDVDATDERPTLVRADGRVVWVLAGKLDGAVSAAERVVDLAGRMAGEETPAQVPA